MWYAAAIQGTRMVEVDVSPPYTYLVEALMDNGERPLISIGFAIVRSTRG